MGRVSTLSHFAPRTRWSTLAPEPTAHAAARWRERGGSWATTHDLREVWPYTVPAGYWKHGWGWQIGSAVLVLVHHRRRGWLIATVWTSADWFHHQQQAPGRKGGRTHVRSPR